MKDPFKTIANLCFAIADAMGDTSQPSNATKKIRNLRRKLHGKKPLYPEVEQEQE